jgi:hypothetical protein
VALGTVPSDLDELIQFLDQSSISTSQGSFVSVENVRKWVEGQQAKALEGAGQPRPKTMVQARRVAARDEELFPKKKPTFHEGGASVPAREPQATIVGEDVNS